MSALNMKGLVPPGQITCLLASVGQREACSQSQSVQVVGHGGGTAGFTGYLRHVPALRRTVVVLINRAGDIGPQGIAERLDLGSRPCKGKIDGPTTGNM